MPGNPLTRGLMILGCLTVLGCQRPDPAPEAVVPPASAPATATTATQAARFETKTFLPVWTGQTRTGEIDAQGRIVSLQCVACHSELEERQQAPAASDLQEVHRGLVMRHGSMSCFSCHDNRADYSTLRLADGTAIAYEEVMTLCSQCHGPQRNDYDHGAHGGMNGYWDLSRGPRERNACTVCHDPHAPSFPRMQPTFKPHDRFLEPSHASQEPAHAP